MLCPNGTHKYASEMMGKGCYEVIGTLQNGQITEMQTVFMGDNFGAPLCSAPSMFSPRLGLCIAPPCLAFRIARRRLFHCLQTWACTPRWWPSLTNSPTSSKVARAWGLGGIVVDWRATGDTSQRIARHLARWRVAVEVLRALQGLRRKRTRRTRA